MVDLAVGLAAKDRKLNGGLVAKDETSDPMAGSPKKNQN